METGIGKHTFNPTNVTLETVSDEVIEHRQNLINFMAETETFAANTFFSKRQENLATYVRPSPDAIGPPWIRPKYEQLDYFLIMERWKTALNTSFQTHITILAQTTSHSSLILNSN